MIVVGRMWQWSITGLTVQANSNSENLSLRPIIFWLLVYKRNDWVGTWLSGRMGGWLSERMSEWEGGWVAEWVGGWVADLVNEWVDESESEWVSVWVSGWLFGWENEWVGGWVVEWVNEWVRYWLGDWVSEKRHSEHFREWCSMKWSINAFPRNFSTNLMRCRFTPDSPKTTFLLGREHKIRFLTGKKIQCRDRWS